MDMNWKDKGVLREFAQHSFVETTIDQFDGLDEIGYIFYPNQCVNKQKKCKLHIFFHDCQMNVNSEKKGGMDKILNLGFLEYSVSNDLIIIFP